MKTLEPFVGLSVLLQFKPPFTLLIEDVRVPELVCFLEKFGQEIVASVSYIRDPRNNDIVVRDVRLPEPKNIRVSRCKVAFPPEVVEAVTFVDNAPDDSIEPSEV
jgi:hypothetical protein